MHGQAFSAIYNPFWWEMKYFYLLKLTSIQQWIKRLDEIFVLEELFKCLTSFFSQQVLTISDPVLDIALMYI